nr:hypothetical protein [uncultured Caproiciproducens sp.]
MDNKIIKLQKGGVVREVATQTEADGFVAIGYEIIASNDDSGDNPAGEAVEGTDGTNDDPNKKPTGGGKKGDSKEE